MSRLNVRLVHSMLGYPEGTWEADQVSSSSPSSWSKEKSPESQVLCWGSFLYPVFGFHTSAVLEPWKRETSESTRSHAT